MARLVAVLLVLAVGCGGSPQIDPTLLGLDPRCGELRREMNELFDVVDDAGVGVEAVVAALDDPDGSPWWLVDLAEMWEGRLDEWTARGCD
jgi:hypothetical protein